MQQEPTNSKRPAFTPAAGYHSLTPIYDLGLAVLTRENYWRAALAAQIGPSPGDVIADIGCGTASLLVTLGRSAADAILIGIDPDPNILDRARVKAQAAGIEVELRQGFAREANRILAGREVNKIVSSLVFHQVPMDEKAAGLAAMYEALVPGGEMHIADYSLQRTRIMRGLFRATVQNLDGRENTEPQARGILPELMRKVGFIDIAETMVVPTITGSISMFRAGRSRADLRSLA
jgi:ubiquinone/menaquinone biosynthesis C-methylase UbiE